MINSALDKTSRIGQKSLMMREPQRDSAKADTEFERLSRTSGNAFRQLEKRLSFNEDHETSYYYQDRGA